MIKIRFKMIARAILQRKDSNFILFESDNRRPWKKHRSCLYLKENGDRMQVFGDGAWIAFGKLDWLGAEHFKKKE